MTTTVQATCGQVTKERTLCLEPLWPECPGAALSLLTQPRAHLHTLCHLKEATTCLQGRQAVATGSCWPLSFRFRGRRQIARLCGLGTQPASGQLADTVQPGLARASASAGQRAGMPASRQASRASRPARQAARPPVLGTSRVGQPSPRMLRTRAATQT